MLVFVMRVNKEKATSYPTLGQLVCQNILLILFSPMYGVLLLNQLVEINIT
jgi:hypothetical protein